MNMLTDPVTAALAIAFGVALSWVIIMVLHKSSYMFRKAVRSIQCRCGSHAPSGTYEAAPGGRDVMRCLYCDCVVNVIQRTKDSLRRTS